MHKLVIFLMILAQGAFAQVPPYPPAPGSAPNLTGAEYFINSDPGFGMGTPIPVSAAQDLSGLLGNIQTSSLPAGAHRLYVRTRDADGGWSLTSSISFGILAGYPDATPVAVPVAGAEYFINNDPGFGNGKPIAVTTALDIPALLSNIETDTMQPGIHRLYVRTRSSNGRWSLTSNYPFAVIAPYPAAPEAPVPIAQVEYYIDSDPGFGNGIPVAINATNPLNGYLVPVNVTGLTQGLHILYLRSRSDRGWSITNTDTFGITQTSPAPLINVNSVTSKVNCAWGSFRISFHATGTYTAGNRFTVQLSDKDGSFANPSTIGEALTTRSSEVYCVLPPHLPDGNNYRIRVVSSNQAVTGISGIDAITIYDRPELGADTAAYIVCQGETYNLVPLYNTSGYTTANWSTANPGAAPAGTYSLIVSNIYGCRDTAQAFVKQDVAFWKGTVNKNWHNPANWNTGRIPNEKTHVIIDSTAANPCEMTESDGTAASVQMRNGGNIQLLNGRKLMIEARCNPLPTGQ
jgi:hypothetical protein